MYYYSAHSHFFLILLKGQPLNLYLVVSRFRGSMSEVYGLFGDYVGKTSNITYILINSIG